MPERKLWQSTPYPEPWFRRHITVQGSTFAQELRRDTLSRATAGTLSRRRRRQREGAGAGCQSGSYGTPHRIPSHDSGSAEGGAPPSAGGQGAAPHLPHLRLPALFRPIETLWLL